MNTQIHITAILHYRYSIRIDNKYNRTYITIGEAGTTNEYV